MRNLREILRQKLALKRSHRKAARAASVSASTAAMAASRAKVLGRDAAALHVEYLEQQANGYRYTTFFRLYREWCDQ